MKFNNKTLGLIFLALLAILILRKVMTKPEVRSIREVLVSIDTSKVDKVILTNGTETPIELNKSSSGWTVSAEGKTNTATDNSVNSILSSLLRIVPDQLISKNKEKWGDYELDESTGKKVEVYSKGKLMDSFYAGRFNFNQNTRSAKTYMRKANEDDVYSVDGFLSMTYAKKYNDFRNKKIFDGISRTDIKKVAISNDNNSNSIGFKNGQWVDENENILDSSKVESYISNLISQSGNEIDDEFIPNVDMPVTSVNLMSTDGANLAELKVFEDKKDDKPFVFISTLNKESKLRSDSSGLYQGIIGRFEELFEE